MKNLNIIAKIVMGLAISFNFLQLNAQEVKATKKSKEKVIDYQIAKNYFINNSVPEGNIVCKITDENEFNKYFGMATTMSKDGRPTAIDFSKKLVVAILTESSSSLTEIAVEKVFLNKAGKLQLNYNLKFDNAPTAMTMRVPQILIIDKKFDKELMVTMSGESIPYQLANRYFVKNTVKDGMLYLPEIKNVEEFDSYFGAATVAGKDGLPTVIDFEKQRVIGIIHHSTKSLPNMKVIDVIQTKERIHVIYALNEAEEGQNWRESLLILLDKKRDSSISFTLIKN